MGYSKEAYEYALGIVVERKSEAERKCAELKLEIYKSMPELREIDEQISLAGIAAVKAATKLDGTDEVLRCKEKYDSLYAKKQNLLSSACISEHAFEPKYTCSMCCDTGYANGVICNCAKSIAQKFEFDKLNSKMPLKESTFDTFSLKYYQGAAATKMTAVLERCRSFAENGPSLSSGLIFLGKTGLGKTHLSLAIANEMLKKGYGVVYGTAQAFLSAVEKEHFGRVEGDTLELLGECDLLIIDDLGAEFTTQFTISALYNLLNSRIMEGKPTVISTNLSPTELAGVYGERISSRIIGSFEPLKFEGNDIRQLKMMEKMKK